MWLKSKLSGNDVEAAAAIEAEPGRPSAPTKVTALLQDVLDDNTAAVEQLRRLLEQEGGAQAVTQTANVTGSGNKLVQAAGSKKIRIG